jgi:hemerythrin
MQLIEWSPELSVKVQEMDYQHQALIDMINQLHDAMGAGKGGQQAGLIIDKMISYAQRHFKAEEKILDANMYPQLARQKAEHELFIRKSNEFKREYLAGKVAISLSISSYLKTWLTGHIQMEDKQYGAFLNAKGIK